MDCRLLLDAPKLVGNWVYARTGGIFPENTGTAIGLLKDNKIVAGVVYEGFTGASIRMHLAIQDKTYLTKAFIRLMFSYPFSQLKVNKMIGMIDSSNTASLNIAKKLGFVQEGVLEGAFLTGDLIMMTMTKPQCRWIKDRK